jgi:hypothetical protein
MELINSTQMQAGHTSCRIPDGRELLVVIVKGTFKIPRRGEVLELTGMQKSLVDVDEYTGEPGTSAPLYELDYSPFKRYCDVLFNGHAYAPGGKPTTRVKVTLSLGPMSKSFVVTGDRVWESETFTIHPGYPGVFDKIPISYDRAFGGIDNYHDNRDKHSAFMRNPVGKGYHRQLKKTFVNRSPMPNTEEVTRSVSMPNGNYTPMSLGPVGRSWSPRIALAGTYDQDWTEHQYPLPPKDFDSAYFQSAPTDQQIPYPQGGEPVYLKNLDREGEVNFSLPVIDMPVLFCFSNGKRIKKNAVIDTIILEPDEDLFSMTWRAFSPLNDNILAVPEVQVGESARRVA